MVGKDIANAMILDHASGRLPEPLALIVASHIAINETAQEKYKSLQHVGGELLEGIAPAAVETDALDILLDRLDNLPTDTETEVEDKNSFDGETMAKVPNPLRPYLNADLKDLKWRSLGGGVKEYPLPLNTKGYKSSLLYIEPGKSIPSHTHRGTEYTLILDGSYEDDGAIVNRGDFVCNDADDEHQPIAHPDQGCLCLAVLDAPLKFKGPLGWIINPFLKV